jgi:hypothetical protein
MRLFEIDDSEIGSLRSVLSVLQGLADQGNQAASLPFSAVKSALYRSGINYVNTPDALIAVKNKIDPAGDVFDISDDGKGTVILNTKVKDPNAVKPATQGSSPTIDAMASRNAKNLKPDL